MTARSLSSERTLTRDLSDPERILWHLRKAADVVAARLRRNGLRARGVRVKLKRSDFQLLTRQRTLRKATHTADEIYATAAIIVKPVISRGPFRLIGLGAYDLSKHVQTSQFDLLDSTQLRSRRLDRVLDEADARFGHGVLRRARELEGGAVLDESPNMDFLSMRDDD